VAKEIGKKLIAQNKKGRHDYFIDEVFEAGLVLVGTEVKSLRAGRATLTDGYGMIQDGEIYAVSISLNITRDLGPIMNQGEIENS